MRVKLARLMIVLAAGSGAALALAQNPPVYVGPVNRSPEPIPVAPGLVTTLVFRLSPEDAQAFAAAGPSATTVTLTQSLRGSTTLPVRSLGLAAGEPNALALTIQIPYELMVNSGDLRRPKNIVTLIANWPNGLRNTLRAEAQTDNIRILTNCELGVITTPSGPVAACAPALLRPDNTLVSAANPARVGETLSLRAVGFGMSQSVIDEVDFDDVVTGVEFGANLPARRPFDDPDEAPTGDAYVRRNLSRSTLSVDAGGIYRITFVVPAGPAARPACGATVLSNATFSVSRNASYDGVAFCVAP
jgi:hypothetical protein